MINLISHCHSKHSFDSNMSVVNIVDEMTVAKVNCIIINDHDTFSLSTDEIKLFSDASIIVFNAIEFTTVEGVHVIGVHQTIKELENRPYTYSLLDLLSKLVEANARIIFPHPFHATGVYGNTNTNNETFEKSIKCADAFEVDNYRYGPTPEKLILKIKQLNPTAVELIGSDAHSRKEVSSFVNVYETASELNEGNVLEHIFTHQPMFKRNKVRSKIYFKFKSFQKTYFYQSVINLVSSDSRNKIKSFLNLR